MGWPTASPAAWPLPSRFLQSTAADQERLSAMFTGALVATGSEATCCITLIPQPRLIDGQPPPLGCQAAVRATFCDWAVSPLPAGAQGWRWLAN
ncbi:MAG: hypothetical protein ACKOPS_26360, partial [Cyanobium sp.]